MRSVLPRALPPRLLVLALAAAFTGCGNGVHPLSPFFSEEGLEGPEGLGVSMDAGVYFLEAGTRGWHGELEFSITNVTDRTISLLNCNGAFGLRLERWSGGEWEYAWGPILPRCLSPPISLEPDESRDSGLFVFGGYPGGNSYPRFRVETVDGIYRLVVTSGYWDYRHDGPSWGEEVPRGYLTSGPFELRTEGS